MSIILGTNPLNSASGASVKDMIGRLVHLAQWAGAGAWIQSIMLHALAQLLCGGGGVKIQSGAGCCVIIE